jgi:hypothetical protein
MAHVLLAFSLLSCAEICKQNFYESACGNGTKITCQCIESIERKADNAIPFTLQWYYMPEQLIPDRYEYFENDDR